MSAEIDDLVNRWVLARYQRERIGKPDQHLAECADAVVTHEATNGEYGCDTGCEYVRLEADISCIHGFTDCYEYGAFGDLADLIDDIRDGTVSD
jgi:hypothetical protein